LPQTTGSIEAKDVIIELPNDGNVDEKEDNITNSWFSIDTESYERQTAVKITLMPKKLNFYIK
jgi:hypothetical protein